MESRILQVLLKQKADQIRGRIRVCSACGKEKDVEYDYYAGTNERNKTVCCDCQKEEGRKLIEDYKAAGCDIEVLKKRDGSQETN